MHASGAGSSPETLSQEAQGPWTGVARKGGTLTKDVLMSIDHSGSHGGRGRAAFTSQCPSPSGLGIWGI